jgi:hypothetical protein
MSAPSSFVFKQTLLFTRLQIIGHALRFGSIKNAKRKKIL